MPKQQFVSPINNRAGIYIHIPFCERLCPYCDFAVTVQKDVPHQAYANALLSEFHRRRTTLNNKIIHSIYFGGGTPSLWCPSQMDKLLHAIKTQLTLSPDVEITLEVNPNQISIEKLTDWRAIGINRLSIGCQSFQDSILKVLRRNHSAQQAINGVRTALGYFSNISLDLMFAIPGQSFRDLEHDLEVLTTFDGLPHISAYNLTIEPGTAFALYEKRGKFKAVDDEKSAVMMQRVADACRSLEMEQYEVSNFARDGRRSRHNKNYWLGGEYLGLGVGAHSFLFSPTEGIVRLANPRNFLDYMKDPVGACAFKEILTPGQHALERLFLGVRTMEGLNFGEFIGQFRPHLPGAWLKRAQELLTELTEQGYLTVNAAHNSYTPTPKGFLFADSLAQRFFDVLESGI